MIKPRPEWITTKDNRRIGMALTWHKALANLITQEQMVKIEVYKLSNCAYLVSERPPYALAPVIPIYKIQKERG